MNKMKSRLLIIIGMILLPFVIPQGFAQCIFNDDWPDAPCFDMGPVPKSEFKTAWSPYYDYKGSEWMEIKKTEMFQALDDGVFNQWTHELGNSNVYHYYVSTDEIQRQFEQDPINFREETLEFYLEIIILSSPIIAVGLIIIFVIRRKRK